MITRRQFLRWGAQAVAGSTGAKTIGRLAGPPTHQLHHHPAVGAAQVTNGTAALAVAPSAPPAGVVDVYHFYSRPDLLPPRVRTWTAGPYNFGGRDGGYVLLTPKGYIGAGPAQQGLMMLDGQGRLRWFLPTAQAPFNLQCQQYKGKPVFTWWEGTVVNGHGSGVAMLADMSMATVARLGPVGGTSPDLHELNLTGEGTALMTAYQTAPADLSPVGGPRNGYVLDSLALEVEVATGKLLHSWRSLDHVPVSESHMTFSGGSQKAPFDYFHINSIGLASDGDLLISSRNTWALYKVGRSTGEVKWRLNGKKSDFKMGTGSQFFWQHHARQQPDGRISIFDDGAFPAEEPQSRALILNIDERAMTCSLDRSCTHPARLLAPNQGSAQVLGDGSMFVGWGGQPYFSTFSAQGELVADGRLPTNVDSYRAFVSVLATAPTTKPSIVVAVNPPGGYVLYASWNGATAVSAWRVLGGGRPGRLATVSTVGWADFETQITVNSSGPYFQAQALDGSGRVLGRSDVIKA